MIRINASAAPAPKAILRNGEKKKGKERLIDEILLYLEATVNRSGQATVGNRSPKSISLRLDPSGYRKIPV